METKLHPLFKVAVKLLTHAINCFYKNCRNKAIYMYYTEL